MYFVIAIVFCYCSQLLQQDENEQHNYYCHSLRTNYLGMLAIVLMPA